MARPPLLLGTHGSITVKREDRRWVARYRYRDLDGKTRSIPLQSGRLSPREPRHSTQTLYR